MNPINPMEVLSALQKRLEQWAEDSGNSQLVNWPEMIAARKYLAGLWRDAKTDPPPAWGEYLVWRGDMDVATYRPDATEQWHRWQAMGHNIGDEVTFWMPLPNRPKLSA